MIKVDGLEPTQEFKEYIKKKKRGEVTMADIKQYLDKKCKVKEDAEADYVTYRLKEIAINPLPGD
ncbi:MAG: hypothetical protein IJ682_08055 [Lachnospiraceae bacterium]|nr:hypothetical protein [Lachnospiraceae bacterium]